MIKKTRKIQEEERIKTKKNRSKDEDEGLAEEIKKEHLDKIIK
jgi:hypothetical protein